MRDNHIAIIGHFGGNQVFLDGQTIKTKILYEELHNATGWKILVVDTYYKKKNPLKLIWQTIVCLAKYKDIIILLSGRGMRLYFPLMSFFAKHFETRVYHDVIGGNLANYVDQLPHYKNYLNSFRVNWTETHLLKQNLEKRGITNCMVLPNFKRLHCITEQEIYYKQAEPYCFCTFSRVMKEKGIEEAIKAVQEINAEAKNVICKLDIYGAVDDAYKERFTTVLAEADDSIRYCGVIPYDKSTDIIKKYYALLFPTRWEGEGFPGTIIDAFSAGLPIIGSNWNANSEIVVDNSGILYPSKDFSDLKSAMMWSIDHPNEMDAMRVCSLRQAQKYQPDSNIEEIIKRINHEKTTLHR